jgi:hypothetical protein
MLVRGSPRRRVKEHFSFGTKEEGLLQNPKSINFLNSYNSHVFSCGGSSCNPRTLPRLIQYEIRLQQLSDERFEKHLAKESGVNTS